MASERLLLNPFCILAISIAFLLASSLSDFTIEFVSADPTPEDQTEVDKETPGSIVSARAGGGFGFSFAGTGGLFPPGDVAYYVDPETGLAYSRDANRLRIQSAGDGFEYPWGLWVSYQHSSLENNFAATAFDADTDTFLVGADFSPFDNSVAGVALAYSDTSTNTFFNSGGSDTDGFIRIRADF